MIRADRLYYILHCELHPWWPCGWNRQKCDWQILKLRWWQDHCHNQVPRSAVSRQYKIICREKEILCDSNRQLFYLAKFNGNVTGVYGRICMHCKGLSWVAWSKFQINWRQPNKFQWNILECWFIWDLTSQVGGQWTCVLGHGSPHCDGCIKMS